VNFTVGLWLVATGRKGEGESRLPGSDNIWGFWLFANSQEPMVFRVSEIFKIFGCWPIAKS
jgi:hypothetical protein